MTPVYRCAVNTDTGEIMFEHTDDAKDFDPGFTESVYTGRIPRGPYRAGLSTTSRKAAWQIASGRREPNK